MIILGIDPGLGATGFGLLERKNDSIKLLEAGIIESSSDMHISDRLCKIYRGLTELVKEYKVDVIVLEKLYSHYKHPVTALLMGHARGIACLVAGENNIPLINYPSTRVKKATTGRGWASKQQVSGMVKNFLNLKIAPEPYDVTDALALAIAHIFITRE